MLASLGYIGYFFSTRHDSLRELTFDAGPLRLAGLVGLMLAGMAIQAWRRRLVICKCSGQVIAYLPLLRIFILGDFLNRIVPQAGMVYRGMVLKNKFGVSYTKYISAYVGFMWMDTSMNILVSALIVAVLRRDLSLWGIPFWSILLMLALALTVGVFVVETLLRNTSPQHRLLHRVHSKTAEIITAVTTVTRDRGYLSQFIVSGLVVFAQSCGTFYLAMRIFGLEPDLAWLAIFYVIIKLGSLVVITPGNIGIRELLCGGLAAGFGASLAQGVAFSAAVRVLSTALVLTLGAFLGGFGILRQQRQSKDS